MLHKGDNICYRRLQGESPGAMKDTSSGYTMSLKCEHKRGNEYGEEAEENSMENEVTKNKRSNHGQKL